MRHPRSLLLALAAACLSSCGGPPPDQPGGRPLVPMTNAEARAAAVDAPCPFKDLCHNSPYYHALASCSPAAATVCAGDSWCCQVNWDAQCVEEVWTIAGSNECGRTDRNHWQYCGQGIFQLGLGKTAACGPTISSVCNGGYWPWADPWCCGGGWDGQCRVEAEYMQPGGVSWDVDWQHPYDGPGRCGDFECRAAEGETASNCSIDCLP